MGVVVVKVCLSGLFGLLALTGFGQWLVGGFSVSFGFWPGFFVGLDVVGPFVRDYFRGVLKFVPPVFCLFWGLFHGYRFLFLYISPPYLERLCTLPCAGP